MSSTPREELGRDFGRLWSAFALSEFGVAFSAGAIAVTAVEVLGASALAVAAVFAAGGIGAAIASLPMGLFIERRQKRPVMIRSDAVRALATLAVTVLLWTETLRLWHLMVFVAASTSLGIAFSAASGAYLKQLVPAKAWSRANARFESTRWTIAALVTPFGGVVVAFVGPAPALAIDAVTYLGSAAMLRSIRSREIAPPRIDKTTQRRAGQFTAGWTYINRVAPLRALFANAMLFGGCITLVGPLLAVFILRDLELGPTHYGIALGLPAVGGVIGSRLSPTIDRRLGWRRTLLAFGSLRTVWMLLIPLGSPGWSGFTLIVIAQFMLMFSAGVFNPVFATYRMHLTNDDHMARVGAAWSISARTVQPGFIVLGGLLAAAIGLRPTILVAATLLVATSILLPWKSTRSEISGIATNTEPQRRPT